MLKIRKEQVKELEQAAAGNFEQRLAEYARATFPKHCRVFDDEGLRKLVRYAMDQAQAYGMLSEKAAETYLRTIFLLGHHFDNDRQYSWTAEILGDDAGEEERADRLERRGMEYLEKAGGAGYAHYYEALRRMRREPLRFERPPRQSLDDYALSRLKALYPQKVESLSPDGVKAAAEHGNESAKAHGISSDPGRFLMIALVFMLGAGFDTDPQFPWAAGALTEKTEQDKVRKLHAEAMNCLDSWLDENG
ncbi:MAG: hypothetical protein ACRD7E_27975 [Bryobacteraceae bacterium]